MRKQNVSNAQRFNLNGSRYSDGYELPRWVFSTAIVVSLHAAFVATLVNWHSPTAGDEGREAIILDLAPLTAPSPENKNDLAPGPEQQQSKAIPELQPPKAEDTPVEKIEPIPSVPDADVRLPEKIKPPDKPVQQSSAPVPETTAPPRPRPSAAQVASWHRKIVLQIERHKNYPASARGRHETGIAELAFTLDRNGKVLASRIARTSGFVSLDQETIATVRRAQPFPPPPSNMPGATFDFTVPIRFNIR